MYFCRVSPLFSPGIVLRMMKLNGDYNIRHKEWFVHSNKIDEDGRHSRDFSIAYDLTHILP